jgi:SAM-dependent methyltransferase
VPIDSTGEVLPMQNGSVDIVYARQVLHHADDLNALVAECARVLRPGGLFLACREHVVDGPAQLAAFLAAHPVHQLAGGESAYPLESYRHAISSSGLVLRHVWGPSDSIVNAFPNPRTSAELARRPREILERKLGPLGRVLARIPGTTLPVRWLLSSRRQPGRLYSFLAQKP